jgi:hypothetical protein
VKLRVGVLIIAGGLAASLGGPACGAEQPTPVDEMESVHIVCTNPRGRVVFTAPDAYGVRVDPTGTIYTYRNGWLSDRTLT